MNEEERQWRNRFSELAERAYARGRYEFTDFLSLAEVQYLYSAEKELAYAGVALWGGYEGAERQIAGFGNCAYEAAFPVCCLKITPTNAKFAEEFTHRDYLGALVNLGLERSTLGDILPVRGAAYVYCLSKVAPFIAENLKRIRRLRPHGGTGIRQKGKDGGDAVSLLSAGGLRGGRGLSPFARRRGGIFRSGTRIYQRQTLHAAVQRAGARRRSDGTGQGSVCICRNIRRKP